MTLEEKITEYIGSLHIGDILSLWNDYCDVAKRFDNCIYNMQDFDEIEGGKAPWDIARDCFFGKHFNPCDEWFWFNGYGNLESSDDPVVDSNSPFYMSELVDYIVDNKESLYRDEIREILDEDEDEIEEEDE